MTETLLLPGFIPDVFINMGWGTKQLWAYILFVPGFFLLIKGADILVTGSSALAKRFGISSLIVGLTVVAFGTSLPEMIVNILSALDNNTDIALGNVIGSNIANILLILGFTAAIFPLQVKESTTWKEIPFSLFAVAILFVMVNDVSLDGASVSIITRSEGIVFLSLFIIFLLYLFETAIKHKEEVPLDTEIIDVESCKKSVNSDEDLSEEEKTEEKKACEKEPPRPLTYKMISLLIFGGLVGLFFGGRWVVDGAVTVARRFHLSEFMISATIVAIGTSLPELVTSIMAAVKKEPDLSVGNIIGSNIFNIFLVLGVTSVIKPIPVTLGINYDIVFTMIVTLYLFLFMFIGRKYRLERWQGITFCVLYGLYLIYAVVRGLPGG